MIKCLGYIFLILAAIGFVIYLFNFVRKILFLRKLKKSKIGLTPYVYGAFRCSHFGITAGTEDTEIFENKESNKVNELDSFYNEIARIKLLKFGSECIFFDEQHPSSSEDKP